jgi:hypothetical protein
VKENVTENVCSRCETGRTEMNIERSVKNVVLFVVTMFVKNKVICFVALASRR